MRQPKSISFNSMQMLRFLWLRHELSSRASWTREKLLSYQGDALRALRAHAYANSPFYRNFHAGLFERPLRDLPILTKRNLMNHWDEVVTDPGLKLDDLRRFIQSLEKPGLFHDRYVASTTSGSTGLKGFFAFDRREWLWGVASHGRATSWAGARIGLLHRLRMAVVSSTKPWCKSLLVGESVDTSLIPTLRLDSTEPLHVIVEKLNAFQPEALIAYAETVNALARRQLAGELRIAPRMVFASSEVFTESARQRVRAAWGSEPYNAYAATEAALIAADCSHHHMHLAEDLLVVEVLDSANNPVPPGIYGDKVLVTVLFSRTVPLIRYELSDRVALAAAPCTCGMPFTVLSGIQGRVEDIIFMPGVDGAPVAIQPDVFHDILEPAAVDGWQVEQDGVNSLNVAVLRPLAGYDGDAIADALMARLRSHGVDAPVVTMHIVDKLKQSAIGKTPLVRALKH